MLIASAQCIAAFFISINVKELANTITQRYSPVIGVICIASAQIAQRTTLRKDFCGQGCYSSIDILLIGGKINHNANLICIMYILYMSGEIKVLLQGIGTIDLKNFAREAERSHTGVPRSESLVPCLCRKCLLSMIGRHEGILSALPLMGPRSAVIIGLGLLQFRI